MPGWTPALQWSNVELIASDLAMSPAADRRVACHECALIQRVPAAASGDLIACVRCGAHLRRVTGERLRRLLPLTIAAAVLFVLTNSTPIVAIEVAGQRSSATITDAIVALSAQGLGLVAALVILTTLVFPTFDLAVLACAAIASQRTRRSRTLTQALRLMHRLRRWAMLEVFMLGVLVAVVKLAALARVLPGIGLWSLAGYIVITAAAHASFDGADYWSRVESEA
jgi:paraquat-inducible protein A